MALTQKGANYEGRDAISNPPSDLKQFARHVFRALDDLASQSQAARTQLNSGQNGPPSPPHPLSAISVAAANGFATITITHNNAPLGAVYILHASTTPNFQNPIKLAEIAIDSGNTVSYQQYLKGQTLYFRGAPKFPASALAQWTYFGGQATPTAVAF